MNIPDTEHIVCTYRNKKKECYLVSQVKNDMLFVLYKADADAKPVKRLRTASSPLDFKEYHASSD